MQNNVLMYLEETVKKFPHEKAIVDKSSSITFSELKRKASHLMMEIKNKISAKNKPIIVYLPKSIDSIISFIGILYSGNFYSPIDTKQPINRVSSILETLDSVLCITDSNNIDSLINCGINNSRIINLDEIDFEQVKEFNYETYLKIIDTDPVYTMFTSGSTGKPKGVTITNRNIINYIEWAVPTFNTNHTTIIGSQYPLHFDVSTLDLYSCLKTGATLVFLPEEYFAFPIRLLEFINLHRINRLNMVPSAYINISNVDILEKVSLDFINTIMFCGEVMPVKHLNNWKRNLPNLKLAVNLYGPTEATVNCTYYIVDKEYKNHEKLPIGYPVSNTELYIIDENNQLVTAPNQIGELYIRGHSLALGYWNDLERTNEVFIQNPLVKEYEEKVYKTGDLVCYNEEHLLMYIGRVDSQIKHQGYRIELGEIEVAANSIDNIEHCCVLYDSNKKKIILCYSGIENDKIIFSELKNILPKYMIPNKIIYLNQMPLNTNDKIDRVLLKTKYLS